MISLWLRDLCCLRCSSLSHGACKLSSSALPTRPRDHPSPAWFVDVAAKAGITVRNVNGGVETKRYIVEATGSGVAIIDYDRDGWPDIFLVNGTELPLQARSAKTAPTSHLFHNNHDGTFTDVTAKAGLVVDRLGPGRLRRRLRQRRLRRPLRHRLRQEPPLPQPGQRHLSTRSPSRPASPAPARSGARAAPLSTTTATASSTSLVANYVHFDLAKTPEPGAEAGCMWKGAPVMCGPRGLPSAPNILFHNRRRTDSSKTSAKPSGIEKTAGHYCFSVTTLDYNEDGWPDLYVACDSTPSILYRNNHDGTFTDVAADAGVAFNEDGREQAGMGSTAADYDGDGHLDLFKTNFSDDTSTLYHANGDGTFTDETFAAGLGINSDALGWGAMFADVDNDGYPDLLVANGHVYPEVDSAKLGATFREPRFLYWNLGNGKFRDLSGASGPGLTEPLSGRGLAIADLWNDGRPGGCRQQPQRPPDAARQRGQNSNHWLGLHLIGNDLEPRRDRRARRPARCQATVVGRRSQQRLELQQLAAICAFTSASDRRPRSTPSKFAGRTVTRKSSPPRRSTRSPISSKGKARPRDRRTPSCIANGAPLARQTASKPVLSYSGIVHAEDHQESSKDSHANTTAVSGRDRGPASRLHCRRTDGRSEHLVDHRGCRRFEGSSDPNYG